PTSAIAGTHDPDEFRRLYADYRSKIDRSIEALRHLPGVRGLTTTAFLPMELNGLSSASVSVEGTTPTVQLAVEQGFVTSGYAALVGADLVAGRDATELELASVGDPHVGVGYTLITRTLAARLVAYGDPVGLVLRERGLRYRVSGV